MEGKHGATWKKAGILEAIRASTHDTLRKDRDLLLSLAQRWSPETNTFIFPWGEATITLEDVMTEEMVSSERQLYGEWFEVDKMGHNRVRARPWAKRFMGRESDIEHEAFLAMWLSRLILPQSELVMRNTSQQQYICREGLGLLLFLLSSQPFTGT
ncbi:hypothetical protein CRG98_011893 [Punica granatum]|uniref:Aminotransferase-like plant mobile domain-containing protein n=1 Tax=Punica granatum TaxID=22663 RepID=A0A2I0KH91_PUNGR|nr:hypothetical protein CRG98_011893 [Punica granatum]